MQLSFVFVFFVNIYIRSSVLIGISDIQFNTLNAHTGHCNRAYIFNRHQVHKIGQSLRIRKCLKELSEKKNAS